jgi:hypothetical protein
VLGSQLETSSQYWLDRVGFTATGSALSAFDGGTLQASDPAGSTTYGCGKSGGFVELSIVCTPEIAPGDVHARFTFEGHWADGTRWSKECSLDVSVTP